jgi:hypothetical protein
MNNLPHNTSDRRTIIKSQLAREAALCRQSSMEVLHEFEALDDDSLLG